MMLMLRLTHRMSEVMRSETKGPMLLRGIAETRAKIAKIHGGFKGLWGGGGGMRDRIMLLK